MRILLVKLKEPCLNAPIVPSLGLWSLRSVAQSLGPQFKVEIVDEQLNYKDTMAEYVLGDGGGYDLVGISAMFTVQHFEALRVAAIAKSLGLKVIVGGIHGSLIGKNYPELFDHSFSGDGEYSISSYLGGHPNWGGGFDNYPSPYTSVLEEEMFDYWEENKPFGLTSKTKRWVPFETSRGCPRNCGFCIVPKYWGHWRPFPIDTLDERMKFLKDHGIEEFFISDDNMSARRDHFLKVMELFKKYGFWWSTPNGFSAKTILDDECFKALSQTNCWQLQIAFDATSEKNANLIDMKQKFVDNSEALKISQRLKDVGIKTVGFFMIGIPGQTLQDMQDTLDFANSLPLDNRHIHVATPYPGTQLYQDCIKNGWLDCKPHELYSRLIGNKSYQFSVIRTPEFSPQEVTELRARDREAALRRRNETHL
jgi:radical SAM superfamily enzyme YgiQ (UPF0313 family)